MGARGPGDDAAAKCARWDTEMSGDWGDASRRRRWVRGPLESGREQLARAKHVRKGAEERETATVSRVRPPIGDHFINYAHGLLRSSSREWFGFGSDPRSLNITGGGSDPTLSSNQYGSEYRPDDLGQSHLDSSGQIVA